MKRYEETKLKDFIAYINILAMRLDDSEASKEKARKYLEVSNKIKTIREQIFLTMQGEESLDTVLYDRIIDVVEKNYNRDYDEKNVDDLVLRFYKALEKYNVKEDKKEIDDEYII